MARARRGLFSVQRRPHRPARRGVVRPRDQPARRRAPDDGHHRVREPQKGAARRQGPHAGDPRDRRPAGARRPRPPHGAGHPRREAAADRRNGPLVSTRSVAPHHRRHRRARPGEPMNDTPWVKSYPAPARWDAPLALGPVYGILDKAAHRFADRPAVEFMGRRATYRQLHALANRAAKGFQQLGVRPGVHVGLYLPNTPHYFVAFFGVLKAGGAVVNYSPLDAAQVLAHKVEDSETQILVTLDLPMLLPQMEALVGHAGLKTLVVGGLEDLGGFPDFAGLTGGAAPDANGRVSFQALVANDGAYEQQPFGDPADTIAVLQYTGGTTGLPKGAMLTHANLTAAMSQYMETTRLDPPVLIPGEERCLLVLPLFHIYSLSACKLLCMELGAESVIHIRFDLDAVINDLAAKKITIFMGVPTMYTALLAHPSLGELDLTALKYCASGGAPLPVEVQNQFHAVTGAEVNEGWRMTET